MPRGDGAEGGRKVWKARSVKGHGRPPFRFRAISRPPSGTSNSRFCRRARAAHLANAEALKLYFFVGGYISKKTRSAKWGSGAINALSSRLQVELPGLRGFSPSSLTFMRLFYDAWSQCPEIQRLSSAQFGGAAIRPLPSGEVEAPRDRHLTTPEIRYLPSNELDRDDIAAFFSIGFTHHREIIRFCKSLDERLYYIRACARGMWSVEQLHTHLRAGDCRHVGALPNNFERTLSPMALATKAVRAFRDEYLLELVNLDNADARADQDVDERVLSKALVADVEKTIQALGGDDFCFMGRERRLVCEGEEFFVDLLFYHRGLRALVAIELKTGKFRPGYLGQLNFYLSALDRLVKREDENPSIGLLLCEEMKRPVVQLAVQDVSKPIGVSTYKTLKAIPQPYRMLAPVIEGVKRVMTENARARTKESDK